MDTKELKSNLTSSSQWLRILFMVLFAVIYTGVFIIAKLVIVLQILFSLVSAKPNNNIQQLSHYLNCYVYHILNYLTYLTDIKPFPFTSWEDTLKPHKDSLQQECTDDVHIDKHTRAERKDTFQAEIQENDETNLSVSGTEALYTPSSFTSKSSIDEKEANTKEEDIKQSAALSDFLDKQKNGAI